MKDVERVWITKYIIKKYSIKCYKICKNVCFEFSTKCRKVSNSSKELIDLVVRECYTSVQYGLRIRFRFL